MSSFAAEAETLYKTIKATKKKEAACQVLAGRLALAYQRGHHDAKREILDALGVINLIEDRIEDRIAGV